MKKFKISWSSFNWQRRKGQALIPLLIVIVIILSLGVAAVELAISNVVVDRYFQEEMDGYFTVESALENALLRSLRNPGYSGEDLQINEASCTIEINGETPKVVTARCESDRWVRRLQAEVSFVNGIMSTDNIREIE